MTTVSAAMDLAPGQIDGPQVFCPSGTVVVGSGFYTSGLAFPGFVEFFGNTVGGSFNNTSSITARVEVQARCASGPGVTGFRASSGDSRDAFRARVSQMRSAANR
jgi:hypothetical protein